MWCCVNHANLEFLLASSLHANARELLRNRSRGTVNLTEKQSHADQELGCSEGFKEYVLLLRSLPCGFVIFVPIKNIHLQLLVPNRIDAPRYITFPQSS